MQYTDKELQKLLMEKKVFLWGSNGNISPEVIEDTLEEIRNIEIELSHRMLVREFSSVVDYRDRGVFLSCSDVTRSLLE